MIDETRLSDWEKAKLDVAPSLDRSVDRSALAGLMLQWEAEQNKADQTAQKIQNAVMELSETVTVGNVKAKYSKGRNSYNYETPCKLDPRYAEEVDNFTTEIAERIIPADFLIDYGALAKMLGVDPLITKPGVPSVKVQII